MPETGNKPASAKRVLSIRLASDGLSFWMDELLPSKGSADIRVARRVGSAENGFRFDLRKDAQANCAASADMIRRTYGAGFAQAAYSIFVYLDSYKTVLVPDSLFEADKAAGFLEFNNFSVEDSEQIEVTRPVAGIVAIIVSNAALMRGLGEALGEFTVLSPIHYTLMREITIAGKKEKKRGKRVIVYLGSSATYISVTSENSLLWAEVIPPTDIQNLRYCIDWINTRRNTGQAPIYIGGMGADTICRVLGKHFSGCICIN